METRQDSNGNTVEVPVPVEPNSANCTADYTVNANTNANTQFLSFDVFAGTQAELEYLRSIGLLDAATGIAIWLLQAIDPDSRLPATARIRR
jgi:hypothetical protein